MIWRRESKLTSAPGCATDGLTWVNPQEPIVSIFQVIRINSLYENRGYGLFLAATQRR
jgi:hypothetical protein